MFAFAIFDERAGTLALVRDPFGIKPLFYTCRDGGVAFASELKALEPVVGVPTVNPTAVIASLMYYWIPDSHCVWEGVSKLPAGTWLEISPSGQRLHRWWDPRTELLGQRDEVGVEQLRAVLEDSVAAHMVADVPVS